MASFDGMTVEKNVKRKRTFCLFGYQNGRRKSSLLLFADDIGQNSLFIKGFLTLQNPLLPTHPHLPPKIRVSEYTNDANLVCVVDSLIKIWYAPIVYISSRLKRVF